MKRTEIDTWLEKSGEVLAEVEPQVVILRQLITDEQLIFEYFKEVA